MSGGELRLDREHFLSRHWQRTPLLIRDAVDNFRPPLAADELAGLAMEDGIESRIIEYCDGHWRVQHGPFDAADFNRDTVWTLLVQAVDHHIPDVAVLRKLVDFLPQWRVDDVMVSYAVDGASAGPHYDNYDVFLLQGEGERQWRLGQFCDAGTALLPHDELRLLEHFECEHEYLLGPGDALYVPPGVAHWGIARGECTTFSIGFRAPRVNDMVSRWADRLLEGLDPAQFYRDSHTEPAARAGEIRPLDLQRATAQVQAVLDQSVDNRWFGELVTEPRYESAADDNDLAQARALLQQGPGAVELSAAAKLAWQRESSGIVVFANGDSRLFKGDILPCLTTLCKSWRLQGGLLAQCLDQTEGAALLNYLLEMGCIYVE